MTSDGIPLFAKEASAGLPAMEEATAGLPALEEATAGLPALEESAAMSGLQDSTPRNTHNPLKTHNPFSAESAGSGSWGGRANPYL